MANVDFMKMYHEAMRRKVIQDQEWMNVRFTNHDASAANGAGAKDVGSCTTATAERRRLLGLDKYEARLLPLGETRGMLDKAISEGELVQP